MFGDRLTHRRIAIFGEDSEQSSGRARMSGDGHPHACVTIPMQIVERINRGVGVRRNGAAPDRVRVLGVVGEQSRAQGEMALRRGAYL